MKYDEYKTVPVVEFESTTQSTISIPISNQCLTHYQTTKF